MQASDVTERAPALYSGLPRCCGTQPELSRSLHILQSAWEGSAEQWNPPTSAVLQPGHNLTVGWRLHLAPSIRQRDIALASVGLATVLGIPGALSEDTV